MTPIAPRLLSFADGAPVRRADWPRRRAELAQAIIGLEYGGMPPRPERTEVELPAKSVIRDGAETKFKTYEVRSFLGNGEIAFLLGMWIPRGDGPFPVVLDGDGCWRYFTDEVVKNVVARGYIAASFNRTAIAADNAAREVYELLGAPEALGWSMREGIHCHAPLDYEALLDFADLRFRGARVARGFQRQVYCNLDSEFVLGEM